jgi:acyl dehydratase
MPTRSDRPQPLTADEARAAAAVFLNRVAECSHFAAIGSQGAASSESAAGSAVGCYPGLRLLSWPRILSSSCVRVRSALVVRCSSHCDPFLCARVQCVGEGVFILHRVGAFWRKTVKEKV